MSAAGEPVRISSRDNPLLKDLRRLAQDATAYRKQGRVWLEGDHLAEAAVQRGQTVQIAVFSASNWPPARPGIAQTAIKKIVIDDALFDSIGGLGSPANVGVVLALPPSPVLDVNAATVVLDRVQDAGNVGSILRSAAAFGFGQVLALTGTAALWSTKVLRAGMGAHFALHLVEGGTDDAVAALQVPLLVTSSHRGALLQTVTLPWPCAWAFGHEGQGISAALESRARSAIHIGQPGGEESLNVAAAAAICLHASAAAV